MLSPENASFRPQMEVLQKYILVTHNSGSYDNELAQKFLADLADSCDRLSLYRVLLDERNLDYTVGEMTDLMNIGDTMVENFLVFRFHRIACVTTPEQFRIIQDFEIVARNRGLNFRAFEDIDSAQAWLTES